MGRIFRSLLPASLACMAAALLVVPADAGNSVLFTNKGNQTFPISPPPAGGAGALDNTVIGATTAKAGNFTNLTATQKPTGAGITALMAAPGAIGGTTAAAGSFTDLTASGQISSTAGAPSIASGNCGATTNGTVAGTNQSGLITIGGASTTTCQVDFSATLAVAPNGCILFPANATAAAAGTTVARVSAITTGHFTVTGAALASANYYFLCL